MEYKRQNEPPTEEEKLLARTLLKKLKLDRTTAYSIGVFARMGDCVSEVLEFALQDPPPSSSDLLGYAYDLKELAVKEEKDKVRRSMGLQ